MRTKVLPPITILGRSGDSEAEPGKRHKIVGKSSNKLIGTFNPLADEALFVREATETYIAEELPALVSTDPLSFLEEERAESW